jgi:regulatory protein
MKVLRIQLMPRKKNRVLVHLGGLEDNEGTENTEDIEGTEGIEPLKIALDVIERSGLHVGDSVTAKDLARLQEDDTKWRTRQAALHLLSYRPRAEQELRVRLRSKGFPHASVEWCLRILEEQGLVDDSAFASAFVRSRIRLRPRGRFRLSQELRQKGVSGEVAEQAIDQAFSSEETSEQDLARAAARGWLARQGSTLTESLAGTDRSDERERARRRLHAFLSRRGFGADVVRVGMEEAERGAREAVGRREASG